MMHAAQKRVVWSSNKTIEQPRIEGPAKGRGLTTPLKCCGAGVNPIRQPLTHAPGPFSKIHLILYYQLFYCICTMYDVRCTRIM